MLSIKPKIYEGANDGTTCHFSKVRDVTEPQLYGVIRKNLVCQDCPIGRSTESSTIEQGSLSRPIGHHWCQGLVNPGLMLSNRYVQVECSSRLEIEVKEIPKMVVGTVHISNGALTHKFTEGDPVLKQVLLNVTLRNRTGKNIGKISNHLAVPLRNYYRNTFLNHPSMVAPPGTFHSALLFLKVSHLIFQRPGSATPSFPDRKQN